MTARTTKKTASTKKSAKKAKTKTTAKKAVAAKNKTAHKKKPAKAAKMQKPRRRKSKAVYRRILEKRQQSLLEAYNISKGNSRYNGRDGTEDYIDYAVSSYHRDFTLSLSEFDRQQLKLVEEALVRLKGRAFGDCMQCGEEIPEKRLEVTPWARHCIRCQELEERGLLEPQEFEQDEDEDDDDLPAEDEEEEEAEAETEEEVDEEAAKVIGVKGEAGVELEDESDDDMSA